MKQRLSTEEIIAYILMAVALWFIMMAVWNVAVNL